MVKFVAAFSLVCALAGGAEAATWDEAIQGDLSTDRLSPTPLSLDLGANFVRGKFGQPDRDYLAVSVGTGHHLSALRMGTGAVIGGVRAFIGVQAGNRMTVASDTDTASALLGWTHFQNQFPGTDLLPDIGIGFEAIGFVGPLPAGTYTFWIQDTSFDANLGYSFNFEVSAVPEPGAYAMMLAGVCLLGAIGRRLKPKE